MSNGPKCIENIKNICEGLNLVRIIKQHVYIHADNLTSVLKTMYPRAQYNEMVTIKHRSKCHYRRAIRASVHSMNVLISVKVVAELLDPIYNFDIANPEYIEPNILELEDLIRAVAEFATNTKFPEDADGTGKSQLIVPLRGVRVMDFRSSIGVSIYRTPLGTELLSIGRAISFGSFNDGWSVVLSIVKLFRYSDSELHEALLVYSTSNFDSEPYHRLASDPNFAYITARYKFIKHVRGVLGVIYDRLLQEREASEQDREINVDAIRDALEELIPGYQASHPVP